MKKKIGWTATLVVLLAVGIWISTRWDAWFSIPDEPPYSAPQQPARVMLTFGTSDASTRNVSWQCDTVVRPSWLEYETEEGLRMRLKATGEVFCSRSGKAAFYVARLRHLAPGRRYRYRVCTDGMYSPWYTMHTRPTEQEPLEWIYVGDVQDSICGRANDYLRAALGRHPEASMLVCGGDLTERPSDEYWAETFRDLDSVRQSVPVLCVTGNHDYLKTVPMRLERRFSLVFSYFLDSMVGDNQVYNLRCGETEFFLLDSNREPNYLWTQRQWLEEKLAHSDAKWKILVLHHPLYSLMGNLNNLAQRWAFDSLVRRYGVALVLQGHEHAYARMTTKDTDGQPTTPVYTVSHCSPKNYRIEFPDEFDRFGISSRYYQTVRISGDTLRMAAYDVYQHQLYDSLLMVRQPDGHVSVEDFGLSIPEYMEYTPRPDNRKDLKYAERIRDYCLRHPERMQPQTTK